MRKIKADRKEYPYDIIFQAEAMYVEEGMTLPAIAKKLDIKSSTIRGWHQRRGWFALKNEYLTSHSEVKNSLNSLARKMAVKADESCDPQTIYALLQIKKLQLQEKRLNKILIEDERDLPRRFIESLQFIAAELKEKDPAGLKILSQHFDFLIKRFKEVHKEEDS